VHLCRSDAGNSSHFRCPYHGYTYQNTGKLDGVPFQKEAYGEEGLAKEEWTMPPAPKRGIYKGMIFASLNLEASPWRIRKGHGLAPGLLLEEKPGGFGGGEPRSVGSRRPEDVYDLLRFSAF
jgi:hypothetical protein